MNREEWLQEAVEQMRPLFVGIGSPLPPLRVSCSWPSARALGRKTRAIGECFFGTQSADKMPQLFISPLLADEVDPQGVLPTLLHECAHVVAGFDAKHGPRFAKLAHKLGLEGKPTATYAGEATIDRMKQIVAKLGKYPHSQIIPLEREKKQGTRMIKCVCGDCGYIARTVKKWLNEQGSLICPCNKLPMGFDILEDLDGN